MLSNVVPIILVILAFEIFFFCSFLDWGRQVIAQISSLVALYGLSSHMSYPWIFLKTYRIHSLASNLRRSNILVKPLTFKCTNYGLITLCHSRIFVLNKWLIFEDPISSIVQWIYAQASSTYKTPSWTFKKVPTRSSTVIIWIHFLKIGWA